MRASKSISQFFRVFLVALTLLCVLVLNNREVATYTFPTGEKPATEHKQTLAKAPFSENSCVLKQKVSLEAVHSHILLHLDAAVAFIRVLFTPPVTVTAPAEQAIGCFYHYFSVFCAIIIQPNAP